MLLPTVISLSSIPPRFGDLAPTLRSLLAQTPAAEAIHLWIPRSYRRFPDWDGRLPEVPEGVTIQRCEQDYGPATKLLPALRLHAGRKVNILFCDDDRLFRPDWLSAMLGTTADHPDCCIATFGRNIPNDAGHPVRPNTRRPRVRQASRAEVEIVNRGLQDGPPSYLRSSGFADLLYGFCGAMVRPEFFDAKVFDIPPVLWAVDDVWISGHLERRGVPIWTDRRIPVPVERPEVMAIASLQDATIENHDRRAADRACIRHFRDSYGIWQPSFLENGIAAARRLKHRIGQRGVEI